MRCMKQLQCSNNHFLLLISCSAGHFAFVLFLRFDSYLSKKKTPMTCLPLRLALGNWMPSAPLMAVKRKLRARTTRSGSHHGLLSTTAANTCQQQQEKEEEEEEGREKEKEEKEEKQQQARSWSRALAHVLAPGQTDRQGAQMAGDERHGGGQRQRAQRAVQVPGRPERQALAHHASGVRRSGGWLRWPSSVCRPAVRRREQLAARGPSGRLQTRGRLAAGAAAVRGGAGRAAERSRACSLRGAGPPVRGLTL